MACQHLNNEVDFLYFSRGLTIKTKIDSQYTQYQTFPLHIHWDGSLSAKYLFDLAHKEGKTFLLPERDIDNRQIAYTNYDERIIHDSEELQRFMWNLRKYKITDVFDVPIQLMQTRENIISAAVVFCHYLKSQNSPYAEAMFAPQYHCKNGLSIEQAIRHAVVGFKKGREETGVDVRLIICIGREAEPSKGVEIARAAIRCNNEYLEHPNEIVGLGLACEERGNPPEKHYLGFRETFETPLKRSVHAGEMCDEETNLQNIRTSVYLLHADGLGHAIPLHKDPNLMETVAFKRIRIESNPICNEFFFKKDIEKDLCLDTLLDYYILATVNPDDPAMIPNGHLADNLQRVGEIYEKKYGKLRSEQIVRRLVQNSINAAWGLSKEEKERYLKDMQISFSND